MQWVCYLEVQGFYASVARTAGVAPPDRPVVVLRDGKVFDGCREAFAGGLRLGAPARQVLRDAPHATVVPFEQLACEAAAHAWWDRSLEYTPYVEPIQWNQLFLALPTPGRALTPGLQTEIARLVDLAAAQGFVAFAGVAPSKLVARAAALAAREGWLLWRPGQGRSSSPRTVITVLPGEEERYLASLPIAYLPSPPEVQRRLARLGIRSIGEAARIPEGEWLRQLGTEGRRIAQWSHGIDAEPVKPAYPARTLEKAIRFVPEVRERDGLERALQKAAKQLARALTDKGEGCQQVELVLEWAGAPPVSGGRTLAKLQQTPYPIQQALQTLLAGLLRGEPGSGSAGGGGLAGGGSSDLAGGGGAQAAGRDGPIRWESAVAALTVRLGLIGPMPWQQMDLWDDSGRRERQERLERALSLLQERFPARMVGLGYRSGLSWREQMLQFHDPYRAQVQPGGV